MIKSIQFTVILAVVQSLNLYAQKTGIINISDVLAFREKEFVASTFRNDPVEKSFSLLHIKPSGSIDTFTMTAEGAVMIECLEIIKIGKEIFLPVVSQIGNDKSGNRQLTVYKFEFINDKINFVYFKQILYNLMHNYSSITPQNVGENLQINICMYHQNEWLIKTVVLDKSLKKVDEFFRKLERNTYSLKLLNLNNEAFFISRNSVFNLTGEIALDPLWDPSYIIMDARISNGKLILLVTNEFQTFMVMVSSKCTILEKRTLLSRSIFRGRIYYNNNLCNVVLNVKTNDNFEDQNLHITLDATTLNKLQQEKIVLSGAGLPFLKSRIETENYEFLIFDEVLDADEFNKIGLRIIKNSLLEKNPAETSLNVDFKVFPNPTQKTLNLEWNSDKGIIQTTIQVFDTNGVEIVTEKRFGSSLSLNVSSWRQGLYKVSLTRNGETTIKSFVISR